MVYFFRKRKPKHSWGEGTNIIYEFDELGALSKLSRSFYGKAVPNVSELKLHLKKYGHNRVELEKETDVKQNDNIQKDLFAPTNSASTELLENVNQESSLSHSSKNQRTFSKDSNHNVVSNDFNGDEEASLTIDKIKNFFTNLKSLYRNQYYQIVQIFVDTLERFQKRNIDQLALMSILNALFRDSPIIKEFFEFVVMKSTSENIPPDSDNYVQPNFIQDSGSNVLITNPNNTNTNLYYDQKKNISPDGMESGNIPPYPLTYYPVDPNFVHSTQSKQLNTIPTIQTMSHQPQDGSPNYGSHNSLNNLSMKDPYSSFPGYSGRGRIPFPRGPTSYPNTNQFTDASNYTVNATAQQRREVAESSSQSVIKVFLDQVRNLFGEKLHSIFLDEMATLQALCQSRKYQFARKKAEFIKRFLSGQSKLQDEFEKLFPIPTASPKLPSADNPELLENSNGNTEVNTNGNIKSKENVKLEKGDDVIYVTSVNQVPIDNDSSNLSFRPALQPTMVHHNHYENKPKFPYQRPYISDSNVTKMDSNYTKEAKYHNPGASPVQGYFGYNHPKTAINPNYGVLPPEERDGTETMKTFRQHQETDNRLRKHISQYATFPEVPNNNNPDGVGYTEVLDQARNFSYQSIKQHGVSQMTPNLNRPALDEVMQGQNFSRSVISNGNNLDKGVSNDSRFAHSDIVRTTHSSPSSNSNPNGGLHKSSVPLLNKPDTSLFSPLTSALLSTGSRGGNNVNSGQMINQKVEAFGGTRSTSSTLPYYTSHYSHQNTQQEYNNNQGPYQSSFLNSNTYLNVSAYVNQIYDKNVESMNNPPYPNHGSYNQLGNSYISNAPANNSNLLRMTNAPVDTSQKYEYSQPASAKYDIKTSNSYINPYNLKPIDISYSQTSQPNVPQYKARNDGTIIHSYPPQSSSSTQNFLLQSNQLNYPPEMTTQTNFQEKTHNL